MASLTNLTRYNDIGANSYFLDLDGQGVVLDSGMHPKLDGLRALPDFERIQKKKVKAIFVSHSHHDHIGTLPLIMQRHPNAKVFMSEPTYYLSEHLLRNSVNVMKRQKVELNIAEYPLYVQQDIDRAVQRWQACHLHRRWSLEGYPLNEEDKDDPSFEFHDAGHILGSVGVEIQHQSKHIFYTGDINLSDQTLTTAAQFPKNNIDTLIIETTRGANPTPQGYSREKIVDNLITAINQTFENGGAVMIPVFALGKMQEMLTILYLAKRQGKLPSKCPIFISGLGKVFSQVYDKLFDFTKRVHPNFEILATVNPEVLNGRKASHLNPKKGQIYLISSGMMTENTLSNVLAQQMLARERDSILFVGYTDPASPAGKLRATPKGQKVTLSKAYGEQPVLCRVEYFDLTSHALREDTLDYIQKLSPKKCFLVHGDLEASQWFEKELKQSSPKIDVCIPEPGKEISL